MRYPAGNSLSTVSVARFVSLASSHQRRPSTQFPLLRDGLYVVGATGRHLFQLIRARPGWPIELSSGRRTRTRLLCRRQDVARLPQRVGAPPDPMGSIEEFLRQCLAEMEPDPAQPGPGRPRVLPALALWAGLLVCVLRGFGSQLAIWRLLSDRGLWFFPRFAVTDQAVYKRLQTAGTAPPGAALRPDQHGAGGARAGGGLRGAGALRCGGGESRREHVGRRGAAAARPARGAGGRPSPPARQAGGGV